MRHVYLNFQTSLTLARIILKQPSVVCPMAPLKIPHGHRIDDLQNQTVYHLGNEVEYECDVHSNEYQLNYTDPISCNNDGKWNPYIPSCNLGNYLPLG